MNTIEEKIGYLIAKVEEQGSDLNRAVDKLDALEKRVDEKFKTAEAAFRVMRFVGYAVAAILTLKFGDLPRLWFHFFG